MRDLKTIIRTILIAVITISMFGFVPMFISANGVDHDYHDYDHDHDKDNTACTHPDDPNVPLEDDYRSFVFHFSDGGSAIGTTEEKEVTVNVNEHVMNLHISCSDKYFGPDKIEGTEDDGYGEKGDPTQDLGHPRVTSYEIFKYKIDEEIGQCVLDKQCGNTFDFEDEEVDEVATIVAHKIVCDDESFLPDWGEGGPAIDENTAIDFIYENSEHCSLEEGWSFEWTLPGTVNPGDTLYGEAGGDWNVFGPTDSNGMTSTEIDEADEVSFLWVREVLKEEYITFTFGENEGTNVDDVSAELYCHTDVLNYDNFDRVDNIGGDETYYCVAFNAPTEPEPTACSDGEDNDGDELVDESDPGCWSDPQDPQTYDPNDEDEYNELEENVVTIVASKVVCDTEDLLPNWGGGGDDITSTTASDYVALYDGCTLEEGWNFEWALGGTPNPGDEIGTAGGDWNTFGTTDGNGVVQTEITQLELGESDRIWVREVFQDGFVPFSHPSGVDVSAEVYCHTDVLNYDNYDFISSPQVDETYYCVAFNAPTEPEPQAECEDGIDNDGDELVDTLDPGCHTDGDVDNPDSYDPNDEDEFDLVPYAPYCGDSEVNQEWEQCDGGVECTAQCQFVDNNQCTDLVLARVNTESFENHANGDVSADVFLGSSANRIPGSVWFALHFNETYFIDPDISSYEDVPGLAVERRASPKELRVLLHGSHGFDGSKEHTEGNVEFWNTTVTGQTNDTSGNNTLENYDNLIKDNIPQEDEIWLIDGEDTKSYFYMTVTTADDSFFTQFDEAPMCEVELPLCSDEIDNDGDGDIDTDDAACHTDNDPLNGDSYDPDIDSENEKPTITLLGDSPINLNIGDTFTDPHAEADDNEDDDITSYIVVGGDVVSTSTIGTYTITYNVSDSEGLAADEVTRNVVVTDPTTPTACSDEEDNDGDELIDELDPACHTDGDPLNEESYDPNKDSENSQPLISRTDGSPVEVEIGSTFTDPSATASDEEDGDITDDIVVGGDTVDTNSVGTYTITYDVEDSEGLAALQVIREVIVIDSSTPPTPVCLNCGGGGGGGGGGLVSSLRIFNESITVVSPGTALISWETNKPATSQVVYGTSTQTITGSTINLSIGDDMLGYALATVETVELTKDHSVLVSSVDLETLYYFRPISEDNTRAIGNELNALLDTPTGESCGQYLEEFIRFGGNNNADQVRKLQLFLNEFEGFTLSVNGIYDKTTFDAVVVFQNKYGSEVLTPWGLEQDTGYVYLTTRKKINEIYCKGQLFFPLTAEQQTEVDAFRALLQGLRDAGEPLPDTSGVGLNDTPEDTPVLADEDAGDEGEELATDEDVDTDTEGDDSLASAIEATGYGSVSATERIIQRIGSFFKGIFGR